MTSPSNFSLKVVVQATIVPGGISFPSFILPLSLVAMFFLPPVRVLLARAARENEFLLSKEILAFHQKYFIQSFYIFT